MANREALLKPAVHRRAEEAGAAERDEGADTMRDRPATERDFGIALVGEQAADRFTDTVERGGNDIGRGDKQERALRARRADIDATTTAGGVRDANFRHFGAEQGEHRVRVGSPPSPPSQQAGE